jgi:hypothetical protein
VLENGQYSESTLGAPQGGVISPLLSNIYLPLLYSIASVSLDFTGFVGLHQSCILNLKGINANTETYRESILR